MGGGCKNISARDTAPRPNVPLAVILSSTEVHRFLFTISANYPPSPTFRTCVTYVRAHAQQQSLAHTHTRTVNIDDNRWRFIVPAFLPCIPWNKVFANEFERSSTATSIGRLVKCLAFYSAPDRHQIRSVRWFRISVLVPSSTRKQKRKQERILRSFTVTSFSPPSLPPLPSKRSRGLGGSDFERNLDRTWKFNMAMLFVLLAWLFYWILLAYQEMKHIPSFLN